MRGLRVIVVGGGIGGLSTAIALRRFGHQPLVLEQTGALRAVGAGISLWPNGIKVLNLLGLGAEVAALGGQMERMAYAGRDGTTLVDFSLDPLYRRVGERARPVVRAELQYLLLEAAGPGLVRLGTRACSVSDVDGGVAVGTEDGGRFEADLVVGADGTHSWLRDHVNGARVRRRYVGYVNWNGLVAASEELAPPGTWLTWVGEGKRVSLMPVGAGRCYWFCDVPLPPVPPPGEGVAAGGRSGEGSLPTEHFADWAPAVGRLFEQVDPAAAARIPIHDTDPLPRWVRKRVVLVGDAAHTIAPDLGQGGCQALEDAWVLTHHLSATGLSVEDALARYEAERRPHTAAMIGRARRRAELTHAADPAATAGWYHSLGADPGAAAAILDGLAQSVETGPCR